MTGRKSAGKESIWKTWSRLSLRSKGVAVLTIPLSALVVAQLAIYQVEGDVASLDQRVVRFYDARAELAQLSLP